MKNLPVEETLRMALEYRSDGTLWWKKEWDVHAGGKQAGYIETKSESSNGYVRVWHRDKLYQAHRIVWLLHHGRWPTNNIDHINGDKSDNRIENLRDTTQRKNMFNRPKYSNNTSGYKGVSWHKKRKRYVATCTKDGKLHHLGRFKCPIEAAMAYDKAAIELHGDHARLNFPDPLSPYSAARP